MKLDINTILSHTKPSGECLVWTRAVNSDGYPRALINGNANAKVHRELFKLLNPNVSVDVVRHSCDNRLCLNPSHLQNGSIADNNRDRDSRQRNGRAKLTHEDVLILREYFKTDPDISRKTLAEKFNVNSRTISSIFHDNHWKWLKP